MAKAAFILRLLAPTYHLNVPIFNELRLTSRVAMDVAPSSLMLQWSELPAVSYAGLAKSDSHTR